jgi:hypothetical protein
MVTPANARGKQKAEISASNYLESVREFNRGRQLSREERFFQRQQRSGSARCENGSDETGGADVEMVSW